MSDLYCILRKQIAHLIAWCFSSVKLFQKSGKTSRWVGLIIVLLIGSLIWITSQQVWSLGGEVPSGPVWTELLIDDYGLVFSPNQQTFDVSSFLADHNSTLSNLSVVNNSGVPVPVVEVILGIAYKHSISPKVLLTLLEMQSGLVTTPKALPSQIESPFGDLTHVASEYGHTPLGFIEQLDWVAQALSQGFFLRRDSATSTGTLVLRDGTSIRLNTSINPGSFSLQYTLAKLMGSTAWHTATEPTNGTFIQVFQVFFGDPLQAPNYLQPFSTIPGASVPFEGGKTWFYSGGPHGGGDNNDIRPWSAVDFASPDPTGCDGTPDMDDWIAASRSGEVLFAASNLVVIAHGDGWRTHYYHVSAVEMQVQTGDVVLRGQLLGHPSCEHDLGGWADGDHVHFATSFNGTQINVNGNQEADGTTLDGWTIQEGVVPYAGTIESPNGNVCGNAYNSPHCPVPSTNYIGTPTQLTFVSQPSLVIPDNNIVGAIDSITIPVAQQGILLNFEVKLTVNHNTVEDLVAEIQSPQQSTLNQWSTIFHRPGIPGAGCLHANVNAYFADGGMLNSEQCNLFPALWGYAYPPIDPFAEYNYANITGTWRIKVADITANNIGTGTLVEWQIIADVITPPPAPVPATTEYCHFPDLPIGDNSTIVDSMTVNEPNQYITDLDAYIVIEHTFVSDLSINLIHPDNTTIPLYDPPLDSCQLDDIHAIFDDEADFSVAGVCDPHIPFGDLPAVFGAFKPEDQDDPLSSLDGTAFSGTWELEITDSATNDEGSLIGWCLVPQLSTSITPTFTPSPTNTPTSTPTPTNTPTPVATATTVPWGSGVAPYNDVPLTGDYNGDSKTDFVVFRPDDDLNPNTAGGKFYVKYAGTGQTTSMAWGAGESPYNDIPLAGDYNGDGKTDFVVYRPDNDLNPNTSGGAFYVKYNGSGQTTSIAWGAGEAPYNDIPLAGDYNGDGKTDFVVFRPDDDLNPNTAGGKFYIKYAGTGQTASMAWGAGEAPYNDIPLAGDYNGDGKTDFVVYRPDNDLNPNTSGGAFYVKYNGSGQTTSVAWGAGGAPYYDIPLADDYNGDGKTDFVIYRPDNDLNPNTLGGTFYVKYASTGQIVTMNWGAGEAPYNDIPLIGDYTGDGKADYAVYRPNDNIIPGAGVFYIRYNG